MRKRLFALLREGAKVVLWDNLREPLGGASIDSFLTASTYTDRILGVSETASLPNRALFICTGNNLRLLGDTCRRVLLARIDPKTEQPFAREFAFDPATVVTRQRQQLVVDVLTIITLLWEDIQRAVEQIETDRSAVVPHFMGAIVLSQIKTYGDQVQAQLSGLSIAIEY